jgi:hypothetical protein
LSSNQSAATRTRSHGHSRERGDTAPRGGSYEAYVRHVDHFGAECVLETARHDLEPIELANLKGYIDAKERTHRRHNGAWEEQRDIRRSCEHCGLDLPRDASEQTRYHARCRSTAKKRRQRERRGEGLVPPVR